MGAQGENGGGAVASSPHERALAHARARDWDAAHDLLAEADAGGELHGEGLELLADAARWSGRDEGVVDPLERAHAEFTARRDAGAAARTALALARTAFDHCREAVGSTWLVRAEELLEGLPERREHGWLAWFRAQKAGLAGDAAGQREHASTALAIAERSRDRGLEALALMEIAHAAAACESVAEAMALAERATAIVLSGETGIHDAGDVLCNAIWLFRSRGAWDRAQQWVDWSTRWVERQRVKYFSTMCRIHRAEVLRVRGKLEEAERETLEAARLLERSHPALSMLAFAELGEVRRRRADVEPAMAAFGRSMQLGWDPQPGMALLLLATGRQAEAARAIERVFRQPPPTLLLEDRANLLTARATVAIANADVDTARTAADALSELASAGATAWDHACDEEARGRLELATGHVEPAIDRLTRARRAWVEIEAPFELARTCVMLGEAHAAAGDHEHAGFARSAAREVFHRIGAHVGDEGFERALAGLPGRESIELAPSRARSDEVSLVREGDYWSIVFGGRTVRLKDSRGVQHLAELLARPGEPVWALELAAAPEHALERGAAMLGDAGPRLDAQARREYAARVKELEDELEHARACADPGRIEAARAEMDAIGRELAAAVGLGGRDRKTGAAAERARQSVTKAIRSVLKKLEEEHPELGEHLLACVRTGTACVFQPDPRRPIAWRVTR